MVALLLPVLLGLVALALDMGTIYANRRALQIAADSAALAAANEMRNQLLDPTAPSGTYNPAGKALDFARRNGVSTAGSACQADNNATVSSNSSPAFHTWQVQTSRLVPLSFAGVLGIPAQCVTASAQAIADLKMMDVMLSLDATASMYKSGTADLPALRQAVVDFINELNPDQTNPNTPKIGLATFAGIKCGWHLVNNQWDPGTCVDDKQVLVNLTTNRDTLIKVANGTGPGSCPSGVSPYGCPIDSVPWTGSAVGSQTTGTKLPNAITVVNNTKTGYYAWDTSKGGRNNSFGEGTARKILVIMTDGNNEAFNFGNETVNKYNSDMISLGNQLKLGKDGQANTADDVEIYTVGFFCDQYTGRNVEPDKWCTSKLAVTSPHPCPDSTSWPSVGVTPSATDFLLRDWSSSSSGTCDHYFPLNKRESLPALFRTLAARLMKVRLTQ